MRLSPRHAVVVAFTLLISGTHLTQAQSLDPAQVLANLHRSIRQSLDFPDDASKHPYWLSLSTVGALASDQSVIDLIGDLAPPVSPYFQSFQYGRRLHLRYQDILNFTVSPEIEFTTNYWKAHAKLFKDNTTTKTPEYESYRTYELEARKIRAKLQVETDPAKKAVLRQELIDHETDWDRFGFRGPINGALAVTRAEEYAQGGTRRLARQQLVEDSLKNEAGLAKLIPNSALSPAPIDWPKPDGWTIFSFSHEIQHKQNEFEERVRSACGGFSLGFVTIGGSGGGTEVTTKNFEKLWKLSYNYELKKVEIIRDWFEPSVFYEGRSYTWRSKPDAPNALFPLIAASRDDVGVPRDPDTYTFNGQDILCPLIPTTLIVARNMSVTATVSQKDWSDVLKKGNVSGGGTLFGIFGGGGSSSWTTRVVKEDKDDVTFEVKMPGPSIIGMISQIVPKCPDPDLKLKWSTGVWLP